MSDLKNMFSLAGRTAVVVGAGGGIGSAVARGLAAFGAHTVCADLDQQALSRVCDEIVGDGGDAVSRPLNITDKAAVEALAQEYADAEVLVVLPAMLVRKKVLDQTDEDFDRQIELNVKGTFRLVRPFGQYMAERGRGSIIGFSSVRASVVEPASGVYAATKAAVSQLLRTLASEIGPEGVRVNLIAPSPVETPLTLDVQNAGSGYEDTARRSMLRRWAQPEDFVGPVLLLATEAGSFMTGTELLVDGGWTAADGMDRTRAD